MILAVLLFTATAFLTFALWQQANMRVHQQSLQLRMNALRHEEQRDLDKAWSPSEQQLREERLDEMRRELNAIKARGGSEK